MYVKLVGHSFARYVRNYAVKDISLKPREAPTDGESGSAFFARKCAESLDLDGHFGSFYIYTQGIVMISDVIISQGQDILAPPPHAHIGEKGVVVLDIGSNDLASLQHIDRTAVAALATSLITLANNFRSELVVIQAVLPRIFHSDNKTNVFRVNADHFNSIVSLYAKHSRHVHYNKCKGFIWKDVQGIAVRVQVNEWSSDGIHVNTNAMPKYIKKMRMTILDTLRFID